MILSKLFFHQKIRFYGIGRSPVSEFEKLSWKPKFWGFIQRRRMNHLKWANQISRMSHEWNRLAWKFPPHRKLKLNVNDWRIKQFYFDLHFHNCLISVFYRGSTLNDRLEMARRWELPDLWVVIFCVNKLNVTEFYSNLKIERHCQFVIRIPRENEGKSFMKL